MSQFVTYSYILSSLDQYWCKPPGNINYMIRQDPPRPPIFQKIENKVSWERFPKIFFYYFIFQYFLLSLLLLLFYLSCFVVDVLLSLLSSWERSSVWGNGYGINTHANASVEMVKTHTICNNMQLWIQISRHNLICFIKKILQELISCSISIFFRGGIEINEVIDINFQKLFEDPSKV